MHYVLNQTIDASDLRHHERRIFGLDAEDDAHFQLHREAIFRNHFKRIKGIDDFARGPFNRLVRCRNHDRRDGQGVDVVTPRANDRLLNAAIPFGHDIGFMSAFIQTPVCRIAGH